eukprot:gene15337-6558_t
MATHLVFLVSLFVAVNSAIIYAAENVCSVIYDDKAKALHVVSGKQEPYVAQAVFVGDSFNKTGWTTLKLTSNETYADSLQARAAGMAEGFITSELIYMHYMNTLADYCTNEKDFCTKLSKFVSDNKEWINNKIKDSQSTEKSYWHQVDLIYTQIQGLQEGYAASKQPKIDEMGFMLLQIFGDLEDLEVALGKKQLRRSTGSGHCSAIIKLLPKNADLMVSQVTWNDYNAMLRVFKLYKLGFHKTDGQQRGPLISGINVSFSSYPGLLYSGDDFHIISSGLVSQETTIGNMNADLWKFITPNSLLEFARTIVANRLATSADQWCYMFEKYNSGTGDDFHIISSGLVSQETTIGNMNADLWKFITPNSLLEFARTIVANRLATSADQWCYMFEKYNSGTYNNQWMVVDYKLFKPESPLQPNTLWILEQIPGTIHMGDMSMKLQYQTYWASFNVPYFPYIYNLSGFASAKAKMGSFFDYDLTPRSQIFKRDHSKITDMHSLFTVMRYNKFKTDPLSKCQGCNPPYSAENAISARSDLNPADGKYPISALGHRRHGGTDCKATNFKLANQLSAWIVAGPTHDDQPVFKWSTSGWKTPMGHPDEFNFSQFVQSWE